jgi:hypothetical protein
MNAGLKFKKALLLLVVGVLFAAGLTACSKTNEVVKSNEEIAKQFIATLEIWGADIDRTRVLDKNNWFVKNEDTVNNRISRKDACISARDMVAENTDLYKALSDCTDALDKYENGPFYKPLDGSIEIGKKTESSTGESISVSWEEMFKNAYQRGGMVRNGSAAVTATVTIKDGLVVDLDSPADIESFLSPEAEAFEFELTFEKAKTRVDENAKGEEPTCENGEKEGLCYNPMPTDNPCLNDMRYWSEEDYKKCEGQ